MSEIFDLIYQFLKWISNGTGLSYRAVNIVVYFIIIPSFFFFLISRIFKEKWIILGFLIIIGISLFIIPDFEEFSNQLFSFSVDFLNWFEIVGLNYVQASVVICVLIPILIIVLLLFAKRKRE